MTTDTASPPPAAPCEAHGSAATKPGWLIPALLLLLWAYAVYRLGALWHSNQDYSFGWLIPLVCLALFRERWKHRPAPDASRPAGGTFLLLGAFGLALLPAVLFLEVAPYWRFAGWIFAGAVVSITFIVFYFLGGRSWSRHFIFPVLFFLIAIPWPSRFERPMTDKLAHLNATASVAAANFLGTPAVRQGTLIATGPGLVGVDEACSGIRSFQASVMVALFLGELFRYSFFRRLILLFGSVALAFACNVVRTTYLVRACDLHGLAALNLRHDEAGLTILGVTLAGLLVLAWWLRPRKSQPADEAPPDGGPPLQAGSSSELEADRLSGDPNFPSQPQGSNEENRAIPPPTRGAGGRAPALLGLALWIVSFELGIELWFRPAEQQATTAVGWSLKLPAKNPEFLETKIPDRTREILRYDEGQSAQWRDPAGRPWQLYYNRWLPARNRYRAAVAASQVVGHTPDICLPNAGMILQTNLGTSILDLHGIRLQVGTERFSDRGRTLHVAVCHWEPHPTALESRTPGTASTSSTSSAIRTALRAFQAHNRGRPEKRVIELAVWGMETDEAAEAAFRECLLAAMVR